MCGIVGIMDKTRDFGRNREEAVSLIGRMNKAQKHRGPDGQGIYVGDQIALGHVRLSVIDLYTGDQPMEATVGEERGAISYNGEIYNMHSLKKRLMNQGITFETTSDTEVLLKGLLAEGIDFLEEVNGVFAFAFWDVRNRRLILGRDPAGVKPLFYQKKGETLLFASEIKAILAYPGNQAKLDRKGLCEILGLGPAKSYGEGVFRGIKEIKPGTLHIYSDEGEKEISYFTLQAKPHTENYEETKEHTKELVVNAIKRQLLSDVELGTLLSGGLDSSMVTAVAARELYRQGQRLKTFSFEFQDNEKHFVSNSFQPSLDAYYVQKMVEHLHTDHTVLTCDARTLVKYLKPAVEARDLPGMADVESSLLYFCGEVAKERKVVLTGECADEIFGGYPWFYKKEMLWADTFPWARDFSARTALLRDEVLEELPLELYVQNAYEKTLQEVSYLETDGKEERRRREVMYLNLRWFMQTLLDRMDRTSMKCGMEARGPFADKEIMEYLFNMPWEMKSKDGEVKGILKEVAKQYLPEEVWNRKKSPYPKTYDPRYEALVKEELLHILEDTSHPFCRLYDVEKVKRFLKGESNVSRPFYGQLMAGPQYMAYLCQIAWWFELYDIKLV